MEFLMGYRSEVAFVLSNKASNLLIEKLDTLSKEEKKDVQSLLEHFDEHHVHESGAELYYWTWIKWYPEYIAVSVIEDFLRSLEEEDFYFIRLGEELGDIEQFGYFYDNPFELHVNCSINYFTSKM